MRLLILLSALLAALGAGVAPAQAAAPTCAVEASVATRPVRGAVAHILQQTHDRSVFPRCCADVAGVSGFSPATANDYGERRRL